MWQQMFRGFKMMLVLTVLTGLAYPLAVTGLCQVFFRHQADGSLIPANGKIVGSELIGQSFTKPEYFHGRPSAAGDKGYDGLASGAANLGPTNQKLADRVRDDVKSIPRREPVFPRAGAGRHGHQLGQRARSRYQSGLGRSADSPRGRRARRVPRRPAPTRGRQHGRPPVRNPRRAPRQRSEAEPRPRPGRAPQVGRTPWSAAGPLAGSWCALGNRSFGRTVGPGGPARTRASAPHPWNQSPGLCHL